MAKKTKLQKRRNYKQKSRTRVKKTRMKRAGKKRGSRKLYGGSNGSKDFKEKYKYLLKKLNKLNKYTDEGQSLEDYVIHNFFIDTEIDILIAIGTLLKEQKPTLPKIFEYLEKIFNWEGDMYIEFFLKDKTFNFLKNAELLYYKLLSKEEREKIISAFKDSEFYSDNTEIIETLISTDDNDNEEIFMIFLQRLINSESESDFAEILVNVLGVIKEIKEINDTNKNKKSCLEIYYEYLNSFCDNYYRYLEMYKPKSKINKDVYNDFIIIREYINNELIYNYSGTNQIKLKLFISSYYFSVVKEEADIFTGVAIGEPMPGLSKEEEKRISIETSTKKVNRLQTELKEKIIIPIDYLKKKKEIKILPGYENSGKSACYAHIGITNFRKNLIFSPRFIERLFREKTFKERIEEKESLILDNISRLGNYNASI